MADDAARFAGHILEIFKDPQKAAEMACRAHQFVVKNKDMEGMTIRLVQSYRDVVSRKEVGLVLRCRLQIAASFD